MNQQNIMTDRELMDDGLSCQKHVTGTYNTFANECATPELRRDMMQILEEEHTIQQNIFDEMSKRGWYQTPPAEPIKMEQAKQKFQNMQ